MRLIYWFLVATVAAAAGLGTAIRVGWLCKHPVHWPAAVRGLAVAPTSELEKHRKFRDYKGSTVVDGMTVLLFDHNGDGRVDFRQYWASENDLRRAESDRNGDGTADKWVYFDRNPVLLEIDENFDGTVDRRR